jgi:transposase-like protein
VVLRPLLERSGRHHADWLTLRNITKKWNRGANYWKAAMTQFAILYEDRFTKPAV